MWNHAQLMRRRGGSTVTLDPAEMRDLVAFLFAQYYFFEPGNAVAGRQVFQTKGCAACHESRRSETGAPDLSHATEAYSPVTLMAAGWEHGPVMLQAMKREKIPWPQFRGAEMRDLISYLNSIVIRLHAQSQ
jgi:mono/diheme cytochrome c family protein